MRSLFMLFGIAGLLGSAEAAFAQRGAPHAPPPPSGGFRGGPSISGGGVGGFRPAPAPIAAPSIGRSVGGYYNGGYYGGGYYGGGYYGGYYPYYGGFGISIYSSPWLYAQPSVRIVTVPETVIVQPADPVVAVPAKEKGMKITSVTEDGPAAKAALRVGDVILSVGTSRVQNFDDLRNTLAPLNGEVEIVFINGENGKREKLPVKVANGRIGVNVEQIDLP